MSKKISKEISKEKGSTIKSTEKKAKTKKIPFRGPNGDKNTIVITNKCWVPSHLINTDLVKKKYTIYRYDQQSCNKCEFLYERKSSGKPYYVCEQCQAFLGKFVLYEKREERGVEYYGLHIGDNHNYEKKIGLNKRLFKNIFDNRSKPKLKYDIEFIGKLRDYQRDARKQWMAEKYGQLMAPPRSGKTCLAVKFTLDLQVKTLIMAHQKDLLTQMEKSFRQFTNISDVEFVEGKQLIGIAKKIEDFSRWPIVLSTYQKFITKKGKIRLEKIKRKFGLIIIDEVHRSNSDGFSTVLSALEARYKIGFTATPKRKDKREFLVEHIIGPVTSKVSPEQVKPRVLIHLTGARPKTEYKLWVRAMLFLAKDKERIALIVKNVVKDVMNGHHVLIPVCFVNQANTLTHEINKALERKMGKPNLAIAFTAKIKDREAALEKIRKGKIKVTVGIRSLIQAGINVPRWSSIHEISPISNRPNFQQEIARIRTPAEGFEKPQPLIRQYVDETMGMCKGCFGTCWQDLKDFDMSQETKEKAISVLKTLSRFSQANKEFDEFKVSVAKTSSNIPGLFGSSTVNTDSAPRKKTSGFGSLNTSTRRT